MALSTITKLAPNECRLLGPSLELIEFELSSMVSHEDHDVKNLANKAIDHLHAHGKGEQISGAWSLSDFFDSDPLRRAAAALGFGNAGDKSCYPTILKALHTEKNDEVLVAFIGALGLVGSLKTCTLLEVFLYHSDPKIRGVALEAICNIGAEEEILTMITPRILDPDHKIQLKAHHALESLGMGTILGLLAKKITSESALEREQGISILAFLKGESILELINLCANDPLPSLRLKTIEILAHYGDPGVRPILSRLTQDKDIDVSERAILAESRFQESSDTRLLDLSVLVAEPENKETVEVTVENTDEMQETNPKSLDEELDKILYEIGEKSYSLIQQGFIEGQEFYPITSSIERNLKLKAKHEKNVDKSSMVGSVKKILGRSYAQELALKRIQLTLEESYLELGMEIFEFSNRQKKYPDGLEQLMERASELFQLLKGTP